MLNMNFVLCIYIVAMCISSYILGKILGKTYKNIILISTILGCGEVILEYIFS